MSGTTTNFGWSYPTGGDVANVASDEQSTFSAMDASLGNAFTAYTPVWTSTGTAIALGNGTIAGRFKVFGKWGFARLTLTMGTTTTFGTGTYRFTLPAGWTLFDTTSICGDAQVFDASPATFYTGVVAPATSTLVEVHTHAATTAVGTTVPITFAQNDIIQLHMRVELA
jgi:hypothetical protein